MASASDGDASMHRGLATTISAYSRAVIINNEDGGSKISINSDHDSYEINSAPMSENIEPKAFGSVVDFIFTEQPLNLKFQFGDGYAELPSGWSRDFTTGLGEPKMIVEVVRGIFGLSKDYFWLIGRMSGW